MTLRVTLSIVRFGDEHDTREIGRLDISNLGPDAFGHCAYMVVEQTESAGWLHDSIILHRRHLGAWELVRKALGALQMEKP